ncbi:hypothetical protein GGQ68_001042 [Sagittula marina]|uniref:Ada DNA repair metal-binding domain-containing protein n=1 Tax=Sagittula marina TaxID=943940 RepID=A0A7W6DK42_9RHOB|nr:hypothetical protein [Sagittula marina]MBB3984726.1 hypothetical protein [Sagittula marina]
MPLQNRVDPFGRFTVTKARGTRMGNRGIVHDGHSVIRTHVHQNWVCCVLSFKGRHRKVMSPGTYAELFFLDEATALAAGHRPCGECQRDRYAAFTRIWRDVHGGPEAGRSLPQSIDRILHRARIQRRRKVTFEAQAADLPDGTMVAVGADAYLIRQGIWRWSFDGYAPANALPKHVKVLTPAPVIPVLRAGYMPQTYIQT